MAFLRQPSTKNWVIVYIVFPLIPFLLGSLIRLITLSGRIYWDTFNASELSICLALAAMLINQCLLRSGRLLNSEEKQEDAAGEAMLYLFFGIIFIALFSVMVAFSICVNNLQVEELEIPLRGFQILIWILMPVIIWYIIKTQKSFRLLTSIL